MTKEQMRQAIISILIGAVVAGLSALFEGAIALLKGHGNDIAGGIVASARYITNTLKG